MEKSYLVVIDTGRTGHGCVKAQVAADAQQVWAGDSSAPMKLVVAKDRIVAVHTTSIGAAARLVEHAGGNKVIVHSGAHPIAVPDD